MGFLVCFESLPLLFPGLRNQWAVSAWGGFGVAEDVNPFVDLFLEFVFVDEAVDLHISP